MGITVMMTGLMAMAFMGFSGIKLSNPTGVTTPATAEQPAPKFENPLE